MTNDWKKELDKYNGENKETKAKIWGASIGLQDVDGLKPSAYLVGVVKENIDGAISLDEAYKKVSEYYKEASNRKEIESEEEADKVSVNIAQLLTENAFNFSPIELSNIHKKLFFDVFKDSGKYRTFNITKNEWVLNGETVIYSSYQFIKETLEYDFNEEKNFSYNGLTIDEAIKHIARFISNIWQVHPFSEGNTRTMAVFLIKYLKALGFSVDESVFKDNSWYFRNALVRANYNNFEKGIYEDLSFLIKFLENVILKKDNLLKNRFLNVSYKEEKLRLLKDSLSIEDGTIINLIRLNPLVKQEELAIKISKSLRTTKYHMAKLQKEGIIKRVNGKRNGKWIVVDSD